MMMDSLDLPYLTVGILRASLRLTICLLAVVSRLRVWP
jgi:hypothetical protein